MKFLQDLNRTQARSRLIYAILTLGVIALGLAWRSRFTPLPPISTKYGGDTLWALMVFVGLGFVFTKAATRHLVLGALCFCWGVEFSQLYHAPWIDMVRSTLPGRLVLGSTFNWPDLPAYVLGIVVGAMGEILFLRRTALRIER